MKYPHLRTRCSLAPGLFLALFSVAATILAQDTSAGSASQTQWRPDLHWRLVGPFRGGRTRAATGVPSEPNVFYVGLVNGGVWKSTD
jgi:hypothetical protein